ncbi:MAG: PTS transporter subunit EIIC [Streptococcaceae bacterium]|jgi:PTS system beta-glucosides-specific IIC component|nr:PTS transporter subunit EIIC [Streptococcaceae bacterium]
MADYKQMAADIIEGVGGGENVSKLIHCITRLRFTLKDKDKADTEKIEAIPGVAGAVYNAGLNQYQVVIGQAVEDVYDEAIAILGDSVVDSDATDAAVAATGGTPAGGSRNPLVRGFQVLIGTITGSMIPIIGLLAAGGMINGLLSLFTKGNGLIDWIDPNSATHTFIGVMAMTPFFFLPVLVGFSAARQLKGNEFVAAAVGGVLINPNLISLLSGTAHTIVKDGITYTGYTPNVVATVLGVKFNAIYFGIPVAFPSPNGYPSYAYTIFPIIAGAALAAPLGRWLHKNLPLALRPIFEPMITFFVTASAVIILVGPIMNLLSGALSFVITGAINFNLGIAGIVIGGLYQVLVIFGLHWLVIPILSQQLAQTGESNINMIVSFTMLAQGVGALAVFIKTKKADMKGLALPASLSAFMGVTEPAMYGINLKYLRVFIMSSIGAAAGAGVAGFMGLKMFGFSGSLIGFPSFVSNPITHEHPANNLMIFWIASAVTIIVAFTLVYMFGYKDTDEMGAGVEKKNAFKDAVN